MDPTLIVKRIILSGTARLKKIYPLFYCRFFHNVSFREAPVHHVVLSLGLKEERRRSRGSGQLVSHPAHTGSEMMDISERKLSTRGQERVNIFAAPPESFSTDLCLLSVWGGQASRLSETAEGLMKHGRHLPVPRHFSLAISLSPPFLPNIPDLWPPSQLMKPVF